MFIHLFIPSFMIMGMIKALGLLVYKSTKQQDALPSWSLLLDAMEKNKQGSGSEIASDKWYV